MVVLTGIPIVNLFSVHMVQYYMIIDTEHLYSIYFSHFMWTCIDLYKSHYLNCIMYRLDQTGLPR